MDAATLVISSSSTRDEESITTTQYITKQSKNFSRRRSGIHGRVAERSGVSIFSRQQQLPPLLPLPSSKPTPYYYRSLPPATPTNRNNRRALSSSPPANKNNSIKKPKSSSSIISSPDRLGPEPSDLPNQVPSALVKRSTSSVLEQESRFGSSMATIFCLAPPPSSLPLPKFSLKLPTKISNCNVEAVAVAGVDAGATDNLRRLLRLC